jgi:glycosyltransferase involved in cell wall biosynthesis
MQSFDPTARTRRILLTTTSYPRSLDDWQSLFIREMLAALARRSDAIGYWGPVGPLPDNVAFLGSSSDSAFLKELGERGGIAQRLRRNRLAGLFTGVQLVRRMRGALRRHRATVDVLHLNWLQSALAIPGAGNRALVTVLGTDYKLLELPGMTRVLRRMFSRNRVALAPNAEWMVPGLEAAFGTQAHVIRYVPFGIDGRFYEVRHQAGERRRRWLTVLRLTRAKLGRLYEWTKQHASDADEFHLFGPMQEKTDVPPWIRYHGPVTPDSLINEWYPRAAGMITLSEHDEGRPQVLLEAMASGVPVIASRLKAHDDLIGATGGGLLAGDEQSFHAALRTLSDPAVRQRFATAARAAVERTYGTWDDCAARYFAVYASLLRDGAP